MTGFEQEALQIDLSKAGNTITLSWRGKSDGRDPSETLDPYLENIVSDLKGEDLVISFKEMNYMNSTSILSLCSFMNELNKKGVKAEVLYDSKAVWQVVSFRAIEILATRMNNISVKGL